MADTKLTLLARRDDGAYLVQVEGSPCALTIAVEDGVPQTPWPNTLEAISARPGWSDAQGDLPEDVARVAQEFVSGDGWCEDFD